MTNIASSSEYIIIAYTRDEREDYSEFLGHSIHFAVSTDSGKTVIPLYHNYGRLFPKCEFSDFVAGEYGCGHNGFFTDEYGDVYITYHGVDAPLSRDIRPGIRRVHFAADGAPILHMTNEQDLPERERNVRIVVEIES